MLINFDGYSSGTAIAPTTRSGLIYYNVRTKYIEHDICECKIWLLMRLWELVCSLQCALASWDCTALNAPRECAKTSFFPPLLIGVEQILLALSSGRFSQLGSPLLETVCTHTDVDLPPLNDLFPLIDVAESFIAGLTYYISFNFFPDRISSF